jgi:hypothetical protein
MKAYRSSLATVSSTLDKAQRMATGLYDAGSFHAFPPPLYTGWISAVLKANENTPADKDMLTRWLTGPANMADSILRTDTGILSVPRAEVVFSPEKIFAIRLAQAKLNAKVFFLPLSPSPEVIAAF